MPRPYGAPTRFDAFGSLTTAVLTTPFGEQVTANMKSSFTVRPTWGVSILREETTTPNLASIVESGGQIVVSTGTDPNTKAILDTRDRGQYVPGGSAQAGIGIQLDRLPTADEEIEAGVFSQNNGFYFLIDSEGLKPAIIKDGNPQVLVPNGQVQPGAFDLTNGTILQIDFTWYGHGPIVYKLLVDAGNSKHMQVFHTEAADGLTITDPNQPIRVTSNNGTQSSDLVVRVGGRQYATSRATGVPRRPTPISLTASTTSGGASFENFLLISPKANFNGRANSVRTVLESFELQADSDIEYRWSYAGELDTGPSPVAPPGIDPSETAIEIRRITDGTINMTSPGRAVASGYVIGGTNSSPKTIAQSNDLPLGRANLLLQVRPVSTDGTVYASAVVEEQW